MAKPNPFSDEIARIKKGVDIHVSWLKEKTGEWESHSMGIMVKDIVLLLDTIAEYKKALDSAMRQVSSLNQGNIADRKRIEELENIVRASKLVRVGELEATIE